MPAPTALRSAGESARTLPCVPTGMKAGVSTAPWGSVSMPVRALPDVAWTVKSNIRLALKLGVRHGHNATHGVHPLSRACGHAFALSRGSRWRAVALYRWYLFQMPRTHLEGRPGG